MRRVIPIVIALVLVVSVRTSAQLPTAFGPSLVLSFPDTIQGQTAPEWAKDHLSAWYEAFNAGDAARVTRLYAPDAVRMPPGQEPVRGQAAIQAFLAGEFDTTRYSCSGDYDGFQAMGDLAVAWGHDNCTATSKSDGATQSTKSRWLSVFERHPTGEWLEVYESWEDLSP